MDYNQALDYLFSLRKQNTKHDFERNLEPIKKFLNFVGNPQNSYKTIHVAGTAGKGSTVYLTSKILSELGYNVGVHMSPHLVSLNEKFSVLPPHGKEILPCSDEVFTELVNWYIKKNNEYKIQNQKYKELSFYEVIIVLVFKYFENTKVDVAVIETALGGKLDATNVIDSEVQVLTSVGYDHMEFLGDTLEEITDDKMRIMKPDNVFVSGLKDNKLNSLIENHARNLKSKVRIIDRDFNYEILESTIEGSKFNFENSDIKIQNLKLTLIGDYQVENAALAIDAVANFTKAPLTPLKGRIEQALSTASLPARFQVIQTEPRIILDGAHNEMKMKAFVESLNKYIPDKEIELLFSCKKGKQLEEMLIELKKLNIKKIYLTQFETEYYTKIESFTNKEMQENIKNILGDNIKIEAFTNPQEAYKLFKNNLDGNRVGVVTGSLYLIGGIGTTETR